MIQCPHCAKKYEWWDVDTKNAKKLEWDDKYRALVDGTRLAPNIGDRFAFLTKCSKCDKYMLFIEYFASWSDETDESSFGLFPTTKV
jgi:hypothetical protein